MKTTLHNQLCKYFVINTSYRPPFLINEIYLQPGWIWDGIYSEAIAKYDYLKNEFIPVFNYKMPTLVKEDFDYVVHYRWEEIKGR